MDNRRLSPNALSHLRQRAVESVIIHGLTQQKACKVFGFSETSMCKYMREYRERQESSYSYKRRGASFGDGSKLSLKDLQSLSSKLVETTPDEVGLEYTLWNSKAIHTYIEREYGVTYHRRSVRKILTKLGFSSQKPIKLAYERNPSKVKAWLEEEYPKIKVRAMQEGARIYWGDEMGMQSNDNRGKVYGIRGSTPVIKKSGSRFKSNILAAISPQGFMNWMVFDKNFTSERFIEFLGRMIRQIKQKIFLVVDNHRVHHSKKVRAYVSKRKDRIELFYLPPYCPDMNPQELVNQDVKANANNFRALKTANDLTINLRYYLTQIQFNRDKIINYFNKKEVAYAAF